MSDLISVIVPIYNSERYVDGCIESVLRQTYSHFELLLIDDGSEDNSIKICEEMCKGDKRIRFIRQKHKGVSAARNRGIREAKGGYLFFLDSDDIIHPQLLEVLHRQIKESRADIATESRYYAGGGDFQKPENWKMEPDNKQEGSYLESRKVIEFKTFVSSETTLDVMGGKLIDREAIGRVHFDERLTHGEDTLFFYQLIFNGANVSVLNRNWYYYRIHEKGANNIYTVKACRSRYRVLRYISDQEMKSNRLANAASWESNLMGHLMRWYETGKDSGDNKLVEYAKKTANLERKRRLFFEVNEERREEFYQRFNINPVLQGHPLLSYIHERWNFDRKGK